MKDKRNFLVTFKTETVMFINLLYLSFRLIYPGVPFSTLMQRDWYRSFVLRAALVLGLVAIFMGVCIFNCHTYI